jgi:type IV pilus assembly protein PilC
MPRYKYKASNLEGQQVEGVAEAYSEDLLEKDLAANNLVLISATLADKKKRSTSTSVVMDAQNLIFFTMELSTSFSAGLPLLQTLEDMATGAETRMVRDVSRGLAERVRGGQSLSESLAAFPKAFPSLYVELIGAAERTGKLDYVLADLVRFLEWQKDTRSQIASATVYPAMMIGAVIMLTLVLTLFVFPKFLSTFAALGDDLPAPTRILLWVDHTFSAFKELILGVIVLFFVGIKLAGRIPGAKYYIDYAMLKAPVLGPLQVKLMMSLFTHNLAMMIGSGLDFSTALRLCERILGNVVFAGIVADARAAIEQGQALSDAMGKGNMIPSLVRRMLKLGETTGKMEESLESVSKYYDKEIPKAIKKMFAILEPVILATMAGVVLFMASAIMLPIYGMMAKMGG